MVGLAGEQQVEMEGMAAGGWLSHRKHLLLLLLQPKMKV
jgi:hypothetical protein